MGEHRVQSNYAPEIRFQVGSAGEAMAIGGQGSGSELVLWTSSSTTWGEGSVPAALDAATARKLINQGALMPPEQTRCTIGAAAMQRLGGGVVHLTAYGESLRVAGPAPAPGGAPVWTVTLMRDSISTLPLMELGGRQGEQPGDPPDQETPKKRGGWGLIPGLF